MAARASWFHQCRSDVSVRHVGLACDSFRVLAGRHSACAVLPLCSVQGTDSMGVSKFTPPPRMFFTSVDSIGVPSSRRVSVDY